MYGSVTYIGKDRSYIHPHYYWKRRSPPKLRRKMRKPFNKAVKMKNLAKYCRELFPVVVETVPTHLSEANENAVVIDEPMLNVDEMLQILEDVKLEHTQNVLQNEAEQYCLNMEAETNALVEDFLHACIICSKVLEFQTGTCNVICGQCAKLHFDSENL